MSECEIHGIDRCTICEPSIPHEEAQENEGTLFSTFDLDCPVKPSPYDVEAE